MLSKNKGEECKMELSVLNVIIVMLVCAMTAFMSHMGMAVFMMEFVR